VLSTPLWLSFWNRTNSALLDKLLRKEKFASEIFCNKSCARFCCVAKEVMIRLVYDLPQNSVRSTASVLLAARRKAIWRQRGMAGSG
jgi:hypothetical protein